MTKTNDPQSESNSEEMRFLEILERWLSGELPSDAQEVQSLPAEFQKKMSDLDQIRRMLDGNARLEQEVLDEVNAQALSADPGEMLGRWREIAGLNARRLDPEESASKPRGVTKRIPWLGVLVLAAGVLLMVWGSGILSTSTPDDWQPQGNHLSTESAPRPLSPIGEVSAEELTQFRWDGRLPAACSFRVTVYDGDSDSIVDRSKELEGNQWTSSKELPKSISWVVTIESTGSASVRSQRVAARVQ